MAVVAVLLIHIEMHRGHGGIHHEHAERARPNERRGQGGERDAAIHAVHEHRLGQDEAADEEKDDGIGKRRERAACVSHARR